MMKPSFISPEVVQKLIEGNYISYQNGDYSLMWLGLVHTMNEGARHCFQILWKNFLRGNLPMEQARLLASWHGTSPQIADLLKRQSLWKTVIVGDGRGNFWLHVPEELLIRLGSAEADNERHHHTVLYGETGYGAR